MESEILLKATEMFLSQGYKTVTMDDIASELSISKKTIYQHYSSKPELIEKSLAYLNQKFLEQLEQTLAKNHNAIEEIVFSHQNIEKIFAIDSSTSLHQLRKYYPKVSQKQKTFHRKKYLRIMENNLHKGIKEGVYRSDIDLEYVARFHLASFVAVDDAEYFPPAEFDHQDIHNLHLEHHIRSIATEKGLQQFKKTLKDQRYNE